jgi:arylsulfatase A-like enzyme
MRDPVDVPTMVATEPRPRTAPPFRDGAPNVMVVVFDDLGFAQLGCYGSDLETPNIDRIAERGLRFTNFHTTAVCSPTRACLLTGRNHHRVGMGMLADMPMGFPGYTMQFPRSAGTLAQILRANGYATTCIGKWHLVPRDQRATGPFDMWPTGLGFDRYYGFLNGETNQWTPNLIRDTRHVEPPRTPAEGYHLDVDLADEAIASIRELRLAHPSRPFLLWYASATPHAPHQAPDEWIERFRGRFDAGWDAWREATIERQREIGILPGPVDLSPRPEYVEPWDSIDPERRRLYSRMMEVCAAYIAHADHQLGRVLDHLDAIGELDRTIVVFVSDNGASAEGGPNGSYNQLAHYISDAPDDIDDELAHLDDLGGFKSNGHYPWGWALAGNAPFRRWKRYTFEGGVRDPFVIAGPGITERGALRHQYAHAIDVLPTLLDLCEIPLPSTLDGIEQMSFDGTSFRSVIDAVDAAETRTSQYYECWGSRAIYHDGWKAVTNHVNQLTAAERDLLTGSHDFASDEWSLYDTRVDPAESTDLRLEHPDRLRELVDRWFVEARRNDVLPLGDGAVERFAHLVLPWMAFRASFDLRPGDKVHEAHGPNLAGGFRMMAVFADAVSFGSTFVLCEQGDWSSGWAWYVQGGEVAFCVAGRGGAHEFRATITPGATALIVEGHVNAARLEVVHATSDSELARGDLDVSIPLAWSPDGSFLTVGYGRPFPVSEAYAPPASAPASLVGVTITVGPPPPLDLASELERILRHQ